MFVVYLLTLKTIAMFLMTFVVFFDVCSLSIDFEVYCDVSNDFCSLF